MERRFRILTFVAVAASDCTWVSCLVFTKLRRAQLESSFAQPKELEKDASFPVRGPSVPADLWLDRPFRLVLGFLKRVLSDSIRVPYQEWIYKGSLKGFYTSKRPCLRVPRLQSVWPNGWGVA